MTAMKLFVLLSLAAAVNAAWTCNDLSITPTAGICKSTTINGKFCVDSAVGASKTTENIQAEMDKSTDASCRQGATLLASCDGLDSTVKTSGLDQACQNSNMGFCSASSIPNLYATAPCKVDSDCETSSSGLKTRKLCCSAYGLLINTVCNTGYSQTKLKTRQDSKGVCDGDDKCYDVFGSYIAAAKPNGATTSFAANMLMVLATVAGSLFFAH